MQPLLLLQETVCRQTRAAAASARPRGRPVELARRWAGGRAPTRLAQCQPVGGRGAVHRFLSRGDDAPGIAQCMRSGLRNRACGTVDRLGLRMHSTNWICTPDMCSRPCRRRRGPSRTFCMYASVSRPWQRGWYMRSGFGVGDLWHCRSVAAGNGAPTGSGVKTLMCL